MPKSTGLVGMWFHSHNDKGEIGWQGQVIRKISDTVYMVQLYSWLTGGETNIHLADIKDMVESWTFYHSSEDMKEYFQYHHGGGLK